MKKDFIVAVNYGNFHWKVEHWGIKQVLHEINRDHSAEWQDYDLSDWEEGWNEWVDPEYYVLLEVTNNDIYTH